ncbi:Ig family protein [Marine Group I thaumarchaeote SCGC AAA799-B03]|uniref:Ig family protein n=1 Tax=Marine Group I thaumarchaeote SCGC AAA799-B03 TaxID=1502289 RepID=A0A087S6U3_9ARCH|nr:Ig family protein [Marine Group I thaumarchaeote SCGC AAA799-B03]
MIATAAYGTELAPQVQFLREIRDNTVMSTASGASFMTGFNQLYYSFSPTIADWERENPMFQEAVRAFITPMISTLSIMTLAEDGSEVEVLGLGISVIALNLAMYIAAPALIGFKVHKSLKSRK